MTDDEIRAAIRIMRTKAQPEGTMHGLWDLIFDAEALLTGGETLLKRDVIEKALMDEIERLRHPKIIVGSRKLWEAMGKIIQREDGVMDLGQRHNEHAKAFLTEVVREIIDDGGTFADVMVVLETMMVGVMTLNVRLFNLSPQASTGLVESAVARAIERFTEMKE